MKSHTILSTLSAVSLSGLLGLTSLTAGTSAPAATPKAPTLPKLTPKESKQLSSYVLGLQNGRSLGQNGLATEDLDKEQFIKGLLEGIKGTKPSYDEAKLQAAMMDLSQKVSERSKKIAEENLAAGKKFLEENGKRKGVTTTKSGLQYEVINKGGDKKYTPPADGAPDQGTQFIVNYRGTLIDGTEFDKSPEGKPVTMNLRVIPGFREALTSMPVGAKWKLFIPSNLAYGPRGNGQCHPFSCR